MDGNSFSIPIEDERQGEQTFRRTTEPQMPSPREANGGDANRNPSTLLGGRISNIPQETSLYTKDSNSNIPRHNDFDAGEPSSSEDEESDVVNADTGEGEILHPVYRRLHRAALRGNWRRVSGLIAKNPDVVRALITEEESALHIAIEAKQTAFAEELINLMEPDDFKLRNKAGETAFFCAAKSGAENCARKMLDKNRALPSLRRYDGLLPIHIAVMFGHKMMVSYLLPVTPDDLIPSDRINLFTLTIEMDMYDIGLKILEKDPTLATAKDSFDQMALEILAKKPLAIGNTSDLSLWKRCLNYFFKGLYNKALVRITAGRLVQALWRVIQNLPGEEFPDFVDRQLHTIHAAARWGNVELLTILTGDSPDLIWRRDKSGHNLFHVSILWRQKRVFNFLCEMAPLWKFTSAVDANKNNVLHLAGHLAPQGALDMLAGGALQMREELIWFTEIEKIVPPSFARKKNKKGKTPHNLFIETHKGLRSNGEEGMKKTANNCMLVATLIATMVFAATFTVPGGNNQDNGTPIFLRSNWFLVFFLSNTIALLFSTTSILIFLSILTSSYEHKNFLKSLPRKMLFGLITLFISIVGMVLAFSATCFLVYESKTIWIPIAVIALAGVPVILFVWLQWELLVALAHAAFGSKNPLGLRKYRLSWTFQMPTPTIDQ